MSENRPYGSTCDGSHGGTGRGVFGDFFPFIFPGTVCLCKVHTRINIGLGLFVSNVVQMGIRI
jgi:hypothetical protein